MKMISLSQRHARHSGCASPACQHPQKIALPILEGYLFQSVADIALLKAESNYSSLHLTNGKKVVVCKTLRSMEAMLQPFPQFARVHRSYIVNLHLIERYIKGKGGCIILQGGQSVSVSNSRKTAFMEALKRCYRQPF